MLGRSAPARESLKEASGIAQELKAASVIASTLNNEGDSFYYAGDFKSARALYEQALQMSAKTSNPSIQLQSALNVAKTDIKVGRAAAALPRLRELLKRAETLRLRPLVAEGTVYLGEALLSTKDHAGARSELESALTLTEKLNMRPLSVTAHYLLGTALAQSGDKPAAARHLTQARQLIDAIRTDARTDDLLKRDDFRGSWRPLRPREAPTIQFLQIDRYRRGRRSRRFRQTLSSLRFNASIGS